MDNTIDVAIPTTNGEAALFLHHATHYILSNETDMYVQAKALLLIVQKMYRVMELGGYSDASLLDTINTTRRFIDDFATK